MISRPRKLASWLRGTRVERVPDLGVRELEVLSCLWQKGEASAKQVLEQLAPDSVTLSTIQSTLERLHRKGLVSRIKQGRAYAYQAVYSQPELISLLLHGIAAELAGGELAPMMSGFAEYVAGEDPEVEAALQGLLNKQDDSNE
jgi:predicted transcriptional regulator